LDLQFAAELSTIELSQAVERLERAIRQEHSDIKHIFIEVKSLS